MAIDATIWLPYLASTHECQPLWLHKDGRQLIDGIASWHLAQTKTL